MLHGRTNALAKRHRLPVDHPAGLDGGLSRFQGALWLSARRGDWSLRTLGVLDAGALLVTCICWAGLIEHSPDTVFTAMLAAMATVTARAAIVPSSARRTLWLTAAALVPIIVGSAFLPPSGATAFMGAFGTTLWVGVAVAISSMIERTDSRVTITVRDFLALPRASAS